VLEDFVGRGGKYTLIVLVERHCEETHIISRGEKHTPRGSIVEGVFQAG
jgi:hypothetical protein